MEKYLFEYWKINPRLRKIKNDDLGITLLKIDDFILTKKNDCRQLKLLAKLPKFC